MRRTVLLLASTLVTVLLASAVALAATVTFEPNVNYQVDTVAQGITNGDFNNDQKLDIATANAHNVSVLLGEGDGTFEDQKPSPAIEAQPYDITSADFDGDGNLDAATADYNVGNGSVSVWLGDGTGALAAPTSYATEGPAFSVISADFDGENGPDLAVGSLAEEGEIISVFLNNGDGTFQTPQIYGPYGEPQNPGLTVADFDGDGNVDLAALSADGVLVFINNGDGTFAEAKAYGGPLADTWAITSGDFDEEKGPDIVVTVTNSQTPYNGGVLQFVNNGDGTFSNQQFGFPGGFQVNDLTSADFDGDGNLDLAVTNWVGDPNGYGANNVSVLLNNGPGAFPLFSLEDENNLIQVGNVTGSYAFNLTSADFDGDEKPDVAVSNSSLIAELSVVAVLINNTAGLGEQPPPGGGPGKRVLVGHKGKELCLPEAALNGHLKHSDEVIDEEGCSKTDQASRRSSK
jgi:hypothetical protein